MRFGGQNLFKFKQLGLEKTLYFTDLRALLEKIKGSGKGWGEE